MMLPRSRPLVLALFLLQLLNHRSSNFVTAQNGGCTLCADGSKPKNGTFIRGGTSCSLIDESSGATPAATADCDMLQITGFMFCGCPTYPDATYCSMCNYSTATGGSSSYVDIPTEYRDFIVPGTTDLTCQDAQFVKKSAEDNDNTCATVQAAAFFCGCPNTTRSSCYLCSDNPTAAVNERLLPPAFNMSCAALDREIGMQTKCSSTTGSELYPLTIDVPSYCGCVDDVVPQSTACSLCGEGNSVLNPNAKTGSGSSAAKTTMTCQDLAVTASFVTDATYCTTLQADANATCCQPAPPTAAPVKSTTGGNDEGSGGGGSTTWPGNTTLTTATPVPAAAPSPNTNTNTTSDKGAAPTAASAATASRSSMVLQQLLLVAVSSSLALCVWVL